jgi:hypothetical protein
MNARSFILAVALMGNSAATAADLVYDNFPDGIFFPGDNFGIQWYNHNAWPYLGNSHGVAAAFTVPIGMSYRLDSLTLPVRQTAGPATNLQISLLLDTGGVPGLVLDTLAINPTGLTYPWPAVPRTFTSSLNPILNGGDTYWVLVQPHDRSISNELQNATYQWAAAIAPPAPIALRNYNFIGDHWNSWNVLNDYGPAFRVEGTAVPEPSTLALLGLGSALFWGAARRRRK